MRRQSNSLLVGLLLTLSGLAIVFGWLSRKPLWDYFFPHSTAPVFTTGLCFLLGGIAITACAIDLKSSPRLRAVFSKFIIVIALLQLMQNLFPINLLVDLTALHSWYHDLSAHPGRMAPNTAIALLLGGFTLTMQRRSGNAALIRNMLAAAVLTIGILGMVSYALVLDLAYSWFGFPRMAFSTGIGVILFGLALILEPSTPLAQQDEVSESDRPGIYIFFGVAVTILAAVVLVSYGSIMALTERNISVEHTYEVRAEFDEMAAFYNQARNSASAAAVTASELTIWYRFSLVKRLSADNAQQQARLATMQRMMEQELASRKATLSTTTVDQSRSAPVPTDSEATPQLENLMRQFKDEESQLLQKRQIASRDSAAGVLQIIVLGNLLGFTMLLLAFMQMRRQNQQRSQLEAALHTSNLELESKVVVRTQQLADLNAMLEQHITERTAELEDLYNNSPCGYHSVDKDGFFVRINDTELAWLGYTRSEVIGKLSHRDIHTPESLQTYLEAFDTFMKTGVLQDQELECLRKDGSTLMVSVNASAIRDQDGNFLISRTTMYDITARKKSAQEITLLNGNLQSQAESLIATNHELESFTYSVSHDLRAPLRAMNGYALMIEEDYADRLDQTGMRYLSVIRNNSERMGKLIDDLLAFSRLGRQSCVKNDLDMAALVQEVADEVARDQATTLSVCQIAPTLPNAIADRALLRQVWVNLISNAYKFSSKASTPAIEISGHKVDNEIIYCVKDNGVGFNMAYYGKLFGVFQRLHHASDFSGTGVGLAIVQRVVLRHGGRVWAESQEGHGAAFYFTLPIETLVSENHDE